MADALPVLSGTNAGINLFRLLGWRALKAPVEFRAPEQRALKSTPHIAWWYIPVAIRRPYFFRQLGIQSAAIYLLPTVGDGSDKIIPSSVPLVCQFPQDVPAGAFHREAGLQYGRVLFIPVLRRNEKEQSGRATITGNACLMQEQNGPEIPADTRIRFQLLIRCGRKRWHQKQSFYTAYIPSPKCSNGQFSLELRYGDDGY